MSMSKQKKLTRDFFDAGAQEWFVRTYDPEGSFAKFPGNKTRMEVVLDEVARLRLHGRILDIGCGTGQLVIELLRAGNDAAGIDIAPGMIRVARKNLIKAAKNTDADSIFRAIDLADFPIPEKPYRAMIALGLLEYLEKDGELFALLEKGIAKGGYAFVECRNSFFNLFSANEYTLALAEKGKCKKLLKEFEDAGRYSPLKAKDIPGIEANVSKAISSFLTRVKDDAVWYKKAVRRFQKYPKGMARRQHTPQELEASAKKFGFAVQYVRYWHAHPYLPRYEKEFPRMYNKIAYLMNPLGRTPLGAWMCSSFIAVLKKK
ncbi:MAG: methyltransferase domain-containing protein [Candidatus Niyogibacteria bacterium]|nr:methyltransferase domain-containing protein [Candidatus Niyogibacteria bacterium]